MYGGGPPGPIEHKAPRLSTPAPAGGDPRKTTPGIAPATVQANLASGGKAFGAATSEARQGNTAQAMTAEAIAPSPSVPEPAAAEPAPAAKAPPALRVAKVAPIAPAPSGKAPPPLRAAERRAAGQLPAPHPAPVITIVHGAQPPAAAGVGAVPPAAGTLAESTEPVPSAAPAATSLNPSGTSAPVTSLSPVVTEEDPLERSRARLSATRARKRRIVAGAAAAAAVAIIGLGLVAPRNLQDAQRMAKGIFGGERESATTAAASRTEGEGRETSTDTNAASAATTPAGTTTPSTGTEARTPAPPADSVKPVEITAPAPKEEPAPTAAKEEPAAKETPAAPAPGVHALLEQINLRGGTFKEAQLTAAFEKLTPKLDQCYAAALEKKPRLKGRLIFQWNVKLNGKVAAAKKHGGTIKDAELAHCSIEAISGTKFPKPKKQAAQIRLPFEYKKS
jgi:hypothetical protein